MVSKKELEALKNCTIHCNANDCVLCNRGCYGSTFEKDLAKTTLKYRELLVKTCKTFNHFKVDFIVEIEKILKEGE